MATERYYFDEASLEDWLDDPLTVNSRIEKLLDCLIDLRNNDKDIYVSSELESVKIGSNNRYVDLYSFDYSASEEIQGLKRDIHLRLLTSQKFLERIDIEELNSGKLLSSDGNELCEIEEWRVASASHIRAHEHLCTLVLEPYHNITGPVIIEAYGVRKHAFVIKGVEQFKGYIRWLLENCISNEEQFMGFWEEAFPDLVRHPDVAFNKFEGGFNANYPEVIKHLSFLNDHFLDMQTECNYDIHTSMQVASAQFGIDFSNESSQTRSSPRKMRERKVT